MGGWMTRTEGTDCWTATAFDVRTYAINIDEKFCWMMWTWPLGERDGDATLTSELPLDFFVYYVGGTAICWNQKDGGWDFLEKMCNAHNLFTCTVRLLIYIELWSFLKNRKNTWIIILLSRTMRNSAQMVSLLGSCCLCHHFRKTFIILIWTPQSGQYE